MSPESSVRLALGLVAYFICSALAQGTESVPQGLPFAPLPPVSVGHAGAMVPNSAGVYEWLGEDGFVSGTDINCEVNPVTLDSWNPVTGQLTQRPITINSHAENAHIEWQARLPIGIIGLWMTQCAGHPRSWFGFVGNDGKILGNDVEFRPSLQYSRTVVISPNALAHVWRTDPDRHLRVEIISVRDNALRVQEMPELPISYHDDFALAAYGSGNLMVLGGGDEQYRGCRDCRNDTYILDVASGQWRDGPKMLEGRSELDATALPGGGILVSGGFTKAADWNTGPSRTAELLQPDTNHFSPAAPMPSANALHHSIELPGKDSQILIMGGTSGEVLGYEPAGDTWQLLASGLSVGRDGGCNIFPFEAAGRLYAWAQPQAYTPTDCRFVRGNYPIFLRQRDSSPQEAVAVPQALLSLRRSQPMFIPSTSTEPALVIGGSNGTAVDSIDPAERVATVQPMRLPHSNGRAFRFNAGVLVFDSGLDDRGSETSQGPMEWLPPSDATNSVKWKPVIGTPPSSVSALASLFNGNLLEVNGRGDIQEISLDTTQTPATLKRTAWPAFTHLRKPTISNPMQIRQIADGRIVFVGGETQPSGYAMLGPNSDQPDAKDDFQFLGPFDGATNYAIFDPQRKHWTESAPSVFTQANTIILEDGRVARFGVMPLGPDDGPTPMEISTSNGERWVRQSGSGLPDLAQDRHILNLSEDLVIKGWLAGDGKASEGHFNVEWFDPVSMRWVTVLTMTPNDPEYRVVTLPNGHTVVLAGEN